MDTGDNELIKCVKEGDLKAFEKVFKDYYALMCSVAMDYVNDSAMCQTLTEDVLLNLWEKKNELVITTSLRAYLFFLYNRSRWQCVVALYRALLAAMVGGRIVWAAVRVVMTGVASVPFTWQIFLTEALVNAIPGIILQLVFIPVLMVALDRTGMVRFRREQAGTQAAGN